MAVSKAGNFFAFGYPNFDSVIQRYLDVKATEAAAGESSESPETSVTSVLQQESHSDSESTDVDEDMISLALSLAPPEVRKENRRKAEEDRALGDIHVEEMTLDELQKLNDRMEDLKKKIADRANDIRFGSVKN
ncbi:OLC1v1035877C1 [Oldenlandia corymbosa var. corymbosa]|uniref:OLC1v1035877C1 n=1 Tax=Oldenlandia corymbosa var. corymbosa TaxID=529605 RepID=A0AAV1CUP6_OLDCO|nr:OLC1v1035877C1 [Oldenlandia corymbosa var. corymbosa]